MKGIRLALKLLVCSLAAALPPAGAYAQSPDAERPSLRLGPVELKPRLALTNVGFDNNVFNESTDPKRDFTFVASPDLEVSVQPGRLRLAFTTGTEFVYFREYTSERSVNRNFAGRAELDLTILKPFVSVSSGQTSSRPNAEIDIRARHHPRLYTAGTRLKVASRSELVLTAREVRDSYEDGVEFRGVELARTLDQRTRGYDAAFNVALTPFTTTGLVVTREEERFDHSPLRDSDSWRIAPTVTFSPLGLVTGTASAGYRQLNGIDPSMPDYEGVIASGSVGILFVSRYKLDTVFTRDVRYSYEETLPYYLVTGVRATLAAQAVGRLEVRALGGRESMTYRARDVVTVPGRDRLTSYGAGLGYRVGERARVVLDLEIFRRTSTVDPVRAYRNQRLTAGLAWGALNR